MKSEQEYRDVRTRYERQAVKQGQFRRYYGDAVKAYAAEDDKDKRKSEKSRFHLKPSASTPLLPLRRETGSSFQNVFRLGTVDFSHKRQEQNIQIAAVLLVTVNIALASKGGTIQPHFVSECSVLRHTNCIQQATFLNHFRSFASCDLHILQGHYFSFPAIVAIPHPYFSVQQTTCLLDVTRVCEQKKNISISFKHLNININRKTLKQNAWTSTHGKVEK